MTYEPLCVDTSRVALPESLLALVERLAENNHDVWARQRLAEGWTYGPARDDARRTHPDLVPYADLPEREKAYDRNTALETVKLIVALGFAVKPPTAADAAGPAATGERLQALAGMLRAGTKLALADLYAAADLLATLGAAADPVVYEGVAQRVVKIGEPLLAYDITARGLVHWPRRVRLRQLQALALARSGATLRANEILYDLYRKGHRDGETLGILARTYKDLWLQAADTDTATACLRRAARVYRQAFDLAVASHRADDAAYTGVNAASMALFLGQPRQARALAAQVGDLCAAAPVADTDYWTPATLGEVAVILGDLETAARHYRVAGQRGRGNYADLGSTRRQARLLLAHLGQPTALFDPCFGVPTIMLFAGHMVDRPDRPQPRFPPELAPDVAARITTATERVAHKIGYSSAACGSDILFLEALQAHGADTHVVLPFPERDFEKASVAIDPEGHWVRRFRRVLRRATSVTVTNRYRSTYDRTADAYTNSVLEGLGRLHARALATDLLPLAVWDGRPGDGPGGTASQVERWRAAGLPVEVIPLAPSRPAPTQTRPAPPLAAGPAAAAVDAAGRWRQKTMALLFADVKHYSQLREETVPAFVEQFMGLVAVLLDTAERPPVVRNSWGDALYLVFEDVRAAGRFALALRDRVGAVDWKAWGLPAGLTCRIGLHAGPVYDVLDPVTRARNCTGTHVNWAARIEPITPPGQVYASQPFAALAATEPECGFTCEYVGRTALWKGFGDYPIYHVRRAADTQASQDSQDGDRPPLPGTRTVQLRVRESVVGQRGL